jgi:outer membrane protein assembly factor BamB
MRLITLPVSLAAALILTIQVTAKQQTLAPIPARVMQAKTVFVENQSGYDRARDEFADELGKWNRLHIVYNKAGADLVVILTALNSQRTTQIAFVDPTTGDNIWTNSMTWSDRGAVRDLLGDLRQRIEQQEQRRK